MTRPADLLRRQKHCRSEVKKLARLRWETVARCNLCMSQRSVIVSVRDRYGVPVKTALCMDCGLFYLVGRFTPDSYDQFYASGSYRRVCSQFNGVEYDVNQIQSDQVG